VVPFQNCIRQREQFWPFEEISIFSNGGHLGYRTALMDTILKQLIVILLQLIFELTY
jgi:hypothetical protein